MITLSRVSQVIKNKNRREKLARNARNQELRDMQMDSAYRAKLYEILSNIEILLSDEEVDRVRIEVPDAHLSKFMKAIYGEEMAIFEIIQVDNNIFDIGRKIVNF